MRSDSRAPPSARGRTEATSLGVPIDADVGAEPYAVCQVNLLRPGIWGRACGQDLRAVPDLGHPSVMELPVELQTLPVFTRATALRAGLSDYFLDQAAACGAVERIAHGVFRLPLALEDGEPWRATRAEHLGRCREAAVLHPGHVTSHQSAAVAHGLQLTLHPAMDVHLTSVERAPTSRREDGVVMHHCDSAANDFVTLDGLRVTTLTRTIADVLRTSRLPHSVALLDAAVRDGVVTAEQVRAELKTQVRWRGRPRALEALNLHDPRRESWLESFSFVSLHELGVPMPQPQVEVLDEGFHFVARVDGLLGAAFLEADGASKYLLLAEELGITPEESQEQTMARQVERHARLVDLGLHGVRWTTQEIQRNPELVVRRVWTAVNSSDPRRFRGWLRIGDTIAKPKPLPHQALGSADGDGSPGTTAYAAS